jgi:hypothetical protein
MKQLCSFDISILLLVLSIARIQKYQEVILGKLIENPILSLEAINELWM